MRSRIITNDFRGLDRFVKSLSDKHVVKVGMLGNKSNRADLKSAVPLRPPADAVPVLWNSRKAQSGVYKADTDGPSNADLGAMAEFGTSTSPARSCLRTPLMVKGRWIVAQAARGAAQMLAKGRMIEVLKRMGISAEVAIIDGFESDGFGSWAPNADSTIRIKGSSAPLVDTGQMKRAVSSRVDVPS